MKPALRSRLKPQSTSGRESGLCTFGGWASGTRVYLAGSFQPPKRRKTSEALWPPKPRLFDKAYSTRWLRAWLGT